MYPTQHILAGLLFSAVLLLLYPTIGFLGAVIIFLVSFGIDVDHYFFYIFKKRDFSFQRAYQYSIEQGKIARAQGKQYSAPLNIFHTVEALLMMGILSLYNRIMLFIFLGALFHFILDFWYTVYVLRMPYARRYTLSSYVREKLFL